jgi:hypothetical protein
MMNASISRNKSGDKFQVKNFLKQAEIFGPIQKNSEIVKVNK